ncbi:hypothetical protein PMAYCL1PPCAC_11866 [Pristionchus mayeri]|uniref:Uncharacterized protein n=1 Tax=Pristionchus mayeri TaxID=1317129 RepID=A0AAN4ZIX6_9BILA|nr:hypothetical protein PMAYCL1PPCAC_11866 [Pristionchus mayeri]
MHKSSSDCVNCTVPEYAMVDPPQTADQAFEIIVVVLVPCIMSVSCLLCCARIFYVYYSYRREQMHRLPVRRRRVRRRRETDYEQPSVSVICPPPNYEQIMKSASDLPPPAYSVQPIQIRETDLPLPPHYTPTEEGARA